MFERRFCQAACLSLTLASASGVLAQTTYPETEPNDTKAAANLVTLSVANDKLTGTCSSADTDYWHIKMAPLAAGFYRNVLTVTPTPTSPLTFTHKIWGLNQTAGVIGTTDTSVFTSTVTSGTNLARSVSWVGFGKEEELNYSISYSSATAAAYTVTYARAAIAPIDMTATSLYAGPITCRVRTVSGNTNSDCWLYDSNLNPLSNDATGPAGARMSLVSGSPTGTMDSFIRTLPAGTYYLAIGGASSITPVNFANLANTQPSVVADTTGAALPVLELPNALVCGVSTGSAATFFADFQDTAGHTVTSTNIVLAANWGGNVNFVKFMVIQPFLPSGTLSANPNPVVPGATTTITVAATPATGGVSADIVGVTADISALTSTPPTTITLTSSDGGVTWTGTAPVDMATTQGNKAIPFTVVEGGSVPGTYNGSGTVTVGPINDICSGAIAVTVGTPSAPVDNTYAGTNDGLTACAAGGKGLWYEVTPAVSASYQVDTCGSGFNTVLTVYQIGDCSNTATWTQLGCNDDRPAGTCTEAQTSAIQNLGMAAGTTYYLRVQSLNNSGTFSSGNAIVTVTQTGLAGACCNHSTGACTLTAAAGCSASTSTYQGDNTSCTPTPCVATGTCCNFTSGACTLIYGGSCSLPTGAGVGTVCDAAACPVVGICCNTGTGACTTIYGGVCPFGTASGVGTVCDASACPVLGICCNNSTGACALLYSGSCASGTSTGAGLVCDASACPVISTCCTNSTGVCIVIYGGSCGFGRTPGTGLVCDASACPITSSCCNVNGVCSLIYGGSCPGGTIPGTGPVCDGSTCPVVGACCNNTTGACTLNYSVCQSGTTANSATVCDPTTCPAIGTCCNNTTGACTAIYSGSCGTGTTANASLTCSTNPCPTVVCCNATTFACTLVAASGDCTGAGGVVGVGSACSPNPCLNDTCATATPIIVGGSTPGDNTYATNDSDPLGAGVACGTLSSYVHAVWFTFTETSATSRRLTANLCSPVTAIDGQLYVLTGSNCSNFACAGGSATSSFGCTTQQANRNPGNDVQTDIPNVVFCTVPGTTYYVVVCTQSGSSGAFVLNLTDTGEPGCDGVTPPPNDQCSGAYAIPSMPHDYYAFPSLATDDLLISCNATPNTAARHGLWYAYTPADSGSLTFKRLPSFAVGSNGDVVITGYAANSCPSIGNEAFCTTSENGSVVATLTAGTPYYFLVSYYSSTITTFAGGAYRFDFTPDTGACCAAAGCSILAQSACTGYWLGAGTVCSTVCADVGACCNGATCATVANAAACTGIFHGAGSSCSPTSPCVTGVCCRGATCTTAYITALDCGLHTVTSASGGPGWAFVTSTSICNAGVNADGTYSGALTSATSPCCFANYNHNSGLEVQDIFDFLNDWFAGRPIAIPGGDGVSTTGLAVQNIFNFLNAWFAGGC